MESSSGVRKGAWAEEEDNLLRQCIQKYGEGKWHQVPLRAGLNRCRKSCRLRWLNYLSPNIKRGEFTADEVDLIIRLRKLLGNRWSLIAGRLLGRTANDVKNYWNSHLHKKVVSCKEDVKGKAQKITKTNIIKPRPRIIKKNLSWLMGKPTIVNTVQHGDNLCKLSTTSPPQENEIMWWENLLSEKEVDERNTCSINGSELEPITNLWAEDIAPGTKVGDLFVEEGHSCWSDFSFDVDLWNLFNSEQERVI